MRVGVLITARLKSNRLTRKVLRDLEGKPLIAHLIDRMHQVHLADSVSIITSTVPQDDELENFCDHHGVKCFRGDPDDVLVRIRDAAAEQNLSWILSVTADNPWVCPVWADRLLSKAIGNNWDFGRIEGLPFGTFSYALKTAAVQKACEIKDTSQTEVWGGYLDSRLGFSTGIIEVPEPSQVRKPKYRLTVDTSEDFKVATMIAQNFKTTDSPASLADIIQFLDANPKILKINQSIQQAPARKIKLKRPFER